MANPNERIHKKLKRDMQDVMKRRINAGLMSVNEARMPKITELLTRTNGYQISLEELKTKPAKENLWKKKVK